MLFFTQLNFLMRPRQQTLFQDDTILELKKHSSIIQMSNITSLQQRKTMNVMLWIARKVREKDESSTTFRLDFNVLRKMVWMKDTNYENIKESLRQLTKIEIEFNVLGKDVKRWGSFNFLSQIIIESGANYCFVDFSLPPIILDSFNDKARWSKLDLYLIQDFWWKYSLALYELLKDYLWLWTIEIEIEKFRKLMWVPDGSYGKYTFLRRSVIDKAVEEVNEKADIKVSFDEKRQWRKVVSIVFYMEEKYNKEKESKSVIDDIDILLQQFSFSGKEIAKIRKKHNDLYIKENIETVEEHYKTKKIDNLKAYMAKALEVDFRPKKTALEIQKTKDIMKKKEQEKLEQEKLKKKEEEKKKKEEKEYQKMVKKVDKFFDNNKDMKEQIEESYRQFIKWNIFYERLLEKWIYNDISNKHFYTYVMENYIK